MCLVAPVSARFEDSSIILCSHHSMSLVCTLNPSWVLQSLGAEGSLAAAPFLYVLFIHHSTDCLFRPPPTHTPTAVSRDWPMTSGLPPCQCGCLVSWLSPSWHHWWLQGMTLWRHATHTTRWGGGGMGPGGGGYSPGCAPLELGFSNSGWCFRLHIACRNNAKHTTAVAAAAAATAAVCVLLTTSSCPCPPRLPHMLGCCSCLRCWTCTPRSRCHCHCSAA
jgi:hypothetical protein